MKPPENYREVEELGSCANCAFHKELLEMPNHKFYCLKNDLIEWGFYDEMKLFVCDGHKREVSDE